MAISFFTKICVEGEEERPAHTIAPYVDLSIGVALVIIAILGTQGVIPMSGNVSYALLGTGSAYSGLFILLFLVACKYRMECTQDLYLFRAPDPWYEEHLSRG